MYTTKCPSATLRAGCGLNDSLFCPAVLNPL
jgi:hypothetical protein